MATTEPDRSLLLRARQGDERAFAAVVDRCGGLVLGLAHRIGRDRHEAEDLAQEVFLRLHQVFDRYDPDRPFLPWLSRVARNLMYNLTAGKARKLRRGTASLDRMKESRGELPVDERVEEAGGTAVIRERAEVLRSALGRVRPIYREILRLRYFGALSYDDLAGKLGLPLGTVKNRLYRAREALAEQLEGAM